MASARATIAGDVTLEHALALVTLSGSLLANGAILPHSPGVASRGSLVFRDQPSGEKYALPISATGAATFTTELFAGTYGVTFNTTTEEGLMGLPVGTATRLERKVVIAEAREFTFDLEPLDLRGVLTLSGGELPSNPDVTTRGNLIFRDRESGGGYAFSVGATGAATTRG